MNRDIEHMGIIVKHLLGAISVVDILHLTKMEMFQKSIWQGNINLTLAVESTTIIHRISEMKIALCTYPVNNEDPFNRHFQSQQSCCYCHIVEVAKTPVTKRDRIRLSG